MKKQRRIRIFKIVFVFLLSVVCLSLVLMLLWNSLIPAIFNGPAINYFQSLGLLLFVRILAFAARPWPYRYQQKGGYWQRKFEEKLATMPPEQRERIRTICASKCGNWEIKQKSVSATEGVSVR